MGSLHHRLKILITSETQESRRFKELEERTGVSAATWKTYWNRGTRPSAELLEAIITAWPDYALWLVTGVDEPEIGHLKPGGDTPRVSSAQFLKSAMAEREIARRILYRKYVEETPGESSDELKESGLAKVEQFLDSAPQLIHGEDDINGEYRAAQARTKLERQQRANEITKLNEHQLALLKVTSRYPYIDEKEISSAVEDLLAAAAAEKKKVQEVATELSGGKGKLKRLK
jgi:transcriptional regulator with XRE-family HTH domain